jgi:hypothetical protein
LGLYLWFVVAAHRAGTPNWKYQSGDEIRIETPSFSSPLVNVVAAGMTDHRHLSLSGRLDGTRFCAD